MRAARRFAMALLAGLVLAAGARAEENGCSDACRDRNAACRKTCAHAGGTSEEQMLCRGRCVDDDDDCRCGCGERIFCAGGNKGRRGCNVLVAWLDGGHAPAR